MTAPGHCETTWHEYAWPTPEQLVDWFETACHECRLRVAAAAIENGAKATECAVKHEGRP